MSNVALLLSAVGNTARPSGEYGPAAEESPGRVRNLSLSRGPPGSNRRRKHYCVIVTPLVRARVFFYPPPPRFLSAAAANSTVR